MSQYIAARDKWKPEKVKFLIIGESPPASGGYFYFEQATGTSGLFVEMMKALKLIPEGKGLQRGFDKKPLLEKFRSLGFFLVDISYELVNKKSAKERKIAFDSQIPRLLKEVQNLDPEKIIIVKS